MDTFKQFNSLSQILQCPTGSALFMMSYVQGNPCGMELLFVDLDATGMAVGQRGGTLKSKSTKYGPSPYRSQGIYVLMLGSMAMGRFGSTMFIFRFRISFPAGGAVDAVSGLLANFPVSYNAVS